jgi:hypothetical protein
MTTAKNAGSNRLQHLAWLRKFGTPMLAAVLTPLDDPARRW